MVTSVPPPPAAGRPQPWSHLPADLGGTVRAVLPELVETIISNIPREVTEYARPLEGEFGAAIRRGVETALGRLLLELPGSDDPPFTPEGRAIYRTLGIGEARTGRSLEALLSAYRLGARMTLRIVSEAAMEAGFGSRDLLTLSEAIFVYFDEVSAASVEGFAEEQSRQVGERDRARQALLHSLLSSRMDEVEVRRLAARAGWQIPERLIAVVLPLENAEGLRLRLGERALAAARGGQAVAILPEPQTATAVRELELALIGRSAWLGPGRHWQSVNESLRAAMDALVVPGVSAPRWVVDHAVDVVLAGSADLIGDLAERRLAPLAELSDNQRERLLETLESWLRWRGERRNVAAEMHVHPQTVGYRLGQLRELFGEDLEDPQIRFELEVVLRARRRQPEA
ncbi:CdaR family transcriptional regulator [Yimella sp. cx-51]|uniref:PucR family transcriptional regulator n=1 Tax=Yimella sp. cx-51 TaxID=2770551 RepID=UPI00165E8964|nr:helix-turn-helix domain-containing protein [Yimella sp. cx-51]MBC9955597.1 helix-turn-helix domain-containing protein [Yimella sp. cx-51]QTH37827.1 helix-turn-helix domain-containing protein [Yimella sp. cx-51]